MTNPNRVAAGRANRAKRPQLSELSRKKLRDAALTNRPWQHATGPRTADGKKRVSINARKAASSCDAASTVDPTLANAAALLKQVSALRRGLYLDAESIQLQQGDSIANQLRDIVINASQSMTRNLAANLMATCSVDGQTRYVADK